MFTTKYNEGLDGILFFAITWGRESVKYSKVEYYLDSKNLCAKHMFQFKNRVETGYLFIILRKDYQQKTQV